MRNIIFRGKVKKNPNITVDDEWKIGSLLTHKDGEYNIITETGHKIDTWNVDPASVGQYIGFKDCNGKMIFEGDILNNYDEPYPLIVKWDPYYLRFALYNTEGDDECGFNSLEVRLSVVVDAEIVGNIYDNPID